MSETADPIAPLWTVHVTLGSAIGALISFVVGGGQITADFTAVALVGTTYLLYKWGQYRDPPSKYSEGDSEREMEMEAEAEVSGAM